MAEDVLLAIREVSTGMLEPPISNFGVKGIRKTAKRVLKWYESMDDDELRWTCFNCFIFIDAKGGTGGGIFRYMYSRFLKEAAAILGDERLVEAGDKVRGIGDRWQDVAGIFKRAADMTGRDVDVDGVITGDSLVICRKRGSVGKDMLPTFIRSQEVTISKGGWCGIYTHRAKRSLFGIGYCDTVVYLVVRRVAE